MLRMGGEEREEGAFIPSMATAAQRHPEEVFGELPPKGLPSLLMHECVLFSS